MRIDHIAYRVKNRKKTAQLVVDTLGYSIEKEFPLPFEDGSKVKCLVLVPPEKFTDSVPWLQKSLWGGVDGVEIEYHLAPEIFISDGDENSIVGKWVEEKDGIGGVHHIAYQVDNVKEKMEEWKAKGYAEFTTEDPITCPGLTQVFTKPSELTGVIYELIERDAQGFCEENVKELMSSTKKL